MTVRDVIKSSLRLIGALAPGRNPGLAETDDALFVLNSMLEAWNTDRLLIYSIKIDQYNLQAGKQSYTIGTGGDFNGARPVKIQHANLIVTTNPSQPLRRPLILLNNDDWAAVRLQAVPSTLPQKLYNDRAFPLSTLYFWPSPTVVYPVELHHWQQIGQFAAATETVAFPEGYSEAIRYNLAVRLYPEWRTRPGGDIQLPQVVVEEARKTKAAIESHNAPTPVLTCELGIGQTGRRGGFNYLTGEVM